MHNNENNKRLAQLMNELDQAKQDIMTLKSNQLRINNRPVISKVSHVTGMSPPGSRMAVAPAPQ